LSKRKYPDEPIVGVGAVVFKGDELLLIKRGNPPLAGEWSIPGGRQEEGEYLIEAVRREIKEECSIDIEVNDLIDTFEYIEMDDKNRIKYHYIVFDFKAIYKEGILEHRSDAAEARWVKIGEFKNYVMKKETREMIIKALNM